jgi:metal-dependent hydrolase (beta-lactamase superfamily II)
MKSAYLATGEYVSYYTTFVVEMNGKTILIDTGNGDSRPPTTGMWMANFKAAGFNPAKVDAAVISHLHSDHFNGLRSKAGQEFFPNAAIHVPAPEYAYWMSKERMDAAPEAQRPMFAGVRRVSNLSATGSSSSSRARTCCRGLPRYRFSATPRATPFS